MSTTTSASSAIFNGDSRYSSDFQSVIQRAVAIASLPITQLTTQQTALGNQTTELNTLDTKFSALQSAVEDIDTAMSSGAYQADISDPSIVSASLSSGIMEGNYSIEVTDLGAYTSTISSQGTLPAATGTNYSLVVGGTTYQVQGDTLAALADSINSSGAAVRATVVNVGSADTPDNRLSVQSSKLGAIDIELNNGSTKLLNTQVTGSLATYKVNGVDQEASSDSRTVTIAPGLSLQLLAKSDTGVATNITVTRASAGVSTALDSFANAYNDAVTELNTQRGSSTGALVGHSIVYSLSSSLSQMMDYFTGGAGVSSLGSLGFSFDNAGKLSFDSLGFLSTDFENSGQVTSFLGSSSGGGFLQAATNIMNSIEDPTEGVLKTEISSVAGQSTEIGNQITDQQASVDQMQTDMTQQMATADAAIATMEQQYNYISGIFQSEQVAAQTYSTL